MKVKLYRWLHKSALVLRFALLAAALLPWNATAIDRADFSVLPQNSVFNTNYVESLLVKGLLEITRGQMQAALASIDQLLLNTPNFKLAHLVRGDLLMAQAQQLRGFGDSPAAAPEAINDLRQEARLRIERYLSQQPKSSLPEPLWLMDSHNQYAIVVDTDKSRLYVYQNNQGTPRYVADYYVTLGKNSGEKQAEGDKRTPLGVYSASGKLTKRLPDFYGEAAYPLDYPNEWDTRLGKRGHGIWLHGTPSSTYSRPPRASDGCVVLSNPDLKTLEPILKTGKTQVIITDQLQWLNKQQLDSKRKSLVDAVEIWRRDWQSKNTDNYLTHYSQDFSSAGADLSTWSRDKRRIQANADHIEIKLSNISMFRYPDVQRQMAVVSFDQDYKSNNLENRMRKRQYWVLENQRWKIIYEGPA